MITIEDIHFVDYDDMDYNIEYERIHRNIAINSFFKLKKSDKLSEKLKKYQLPKDSSV